jgi:hypothetical protein
LDALLEVFEESAPASPVFLGSFADAEYLLVTLAVHTDRDKQRDVADIARPTALISFVDFRVRIFVDVPFARLRSYRRR